jgi:hypothetical protein
MSHRLGRRGKEMPPILPSALAVAKQTQVRFVHQRGRLESLPGPLVRHLGGGEPPKLIIHQRQQLVRDPGFGSIRLLQDLDDVVHVQQ